jgi:type VI protein secretion system component Hcp
MARGTSSRHAGWCLALLLSGALAPARAQAPQDDFSGTWGSNIGLTYIITQSGSQVSWKDSTGVVGTIVLTASGLSTTWSDATGQHSATGTIVERDSGGRPTKIAWSNAVVMQRAAQFAAQIAKPAFQVAPVAPPPKAVQAVPNVQGVQLPGTTVLASTLPPPQGPYTVLLWIPGLNEDLFFPSGGVRLRSTSLRVAPGGPLAAGTGGAGGALQRTELLPISISKPVDLLSPLLMEAAAKGRVFPSLSISVFFENPSGNPPNILWTLKQVVVLSYTATAESGAQGSGPFEELTLDYAEIGYVFKDSPTNSSNRLINVTVHR